MLRGHSDIVLTLAGSDMRLYSGRSLACARLSVCMIIFVTVALTLTFDVVVGVGCALQAPATSLSGSGISPTCHTTSCLVRNVDIKARGMNVRSAVVTRFELFATP